MWANEWGEVESESFLAPTPPSTDQPRIFHYLQSYFGLVLLHALVLTSVVIEAGVVTWRGAPATGCPRTSASRAYSRGGARAPLNARPHLAPALGAGAAGTVVSPAVSWSRVAGGMK